MYVSIYYHADTSALEALASDDTVKVSKMKWGWLFDGPCEETALFFYPGAKVEASSYASLLHRLAENGMDACLVHMPLHLAIFDIDAASRVMDTCSYKNWYIGGHSLGGAMAAQYAADHGDELRGVILCAAYPIKKLDSSLTQVQLYGSKDRILNMDKVRQNAQYAPPRSTEHVIQGGNHAQFGNYGIQKGDGAASISADQQQEEAVQVILENS